MTRRVFLISFGVFVVLTATVGYVIDHWIYYVLIALIVGGWVLFARLAERSSRTRASVRDLTWGSTVALSLGSLVALGVVAETLGGAAALLATILVAVGLIAAVELIVRTRARFLSADPPASASG